MGGCEIFVWGRVLSLSSLYCALGYQHYPHPPWISPGFRLGSPKWVAVEAQSWVDEGAAGFGQNTMRNIVFCLISKA